ncbi:DUF481 domain-containing protein [Halioxenophilus sp. WMMB6]|uniref:DUF481 domain-containing protein n=1 Tax=Halioxenophilus sp. WMMB6 TaxID=3073815 RepID=UPI00295ED739|nr:DUF481 domain-containing protein [Halioxenophilus sp. WMMB6]
MTSKRFIAATILTFASSAGFASEWSGVGEAGLVMVDGNSESQVVNASLTFENSREKWDHKLKLAATSAESDGTKDAESYLANWDSQYSLTERTYLFGDLRYFDDKFDSFEAIYTTAFGAGYKIFNTDTMKWKVSAGAGYRTTKLEETQEKQSGINYLITSDYKYQLTETATLLNETRVEISSDNTFTQSIFGFAVAINSSMALKLGYEIRYNSDPAQGDLHADTITSANLVYNF